MRGKIVSFNLFLRILPTYNKIVPVLNNVVANNQYGFKRNRSTITILHNFKTVVSDALLHLHLTVDVNKLVLLKHLIK